MVETIKIRGKEYTFQSYPVVSNKQRIHVVEGGSGPLVILAHGFPESWYIWRFQMADLIANGFRVAAITPRGYGRSSKPRDVESYRITELARDFAGLPAALGEEKAILVGHDWGAIISWTAAWLYPERFRAIAALSNAFGGSNVSSLPFSDESRPISEVLREWGGEDKMFYQEYYTHMDLAEYEVNYNIRTWLFNAFYGWSGLPALPEPLKGIDRMNMTDEQMRTILPQTSIFRDRKSPVNIRERFAVPNPEWLQEEDLDYMVNQYAYSGFYGGMFHYKAADINHELLANREKRIRIPACYIAGDRDWCAIWGRDAIADLPKVCDDYRGTHILPGVGHWLTMEKADEVSRILLDFVRPFA